MSRRRGGGVIVINEVGLLADLRERERETDRESGYESMRYIVVCVLLILSFCCAKRLTVIRESRVESRESRAGRSSFNTRDGRKGTEGKSKGMGRGERERDESNQKIRRSEIISLFLSRFSSLTSQNETRYR